LVVSVKWLLLAPKQPAATCVQSAMRASPGLCAVLLAGCGGTTASATTSPPPTVASHSIEPAEACALRLDLPVLDASASALPLDLYARALAPVVAALCACTQSEDRARIQVQVLPERGEVRATAPDVSRIDGCLAERLRPGRFTRFEVPPGVECGDDCGPRRNVAPSRPGPIERFEAKTHLSSRRDGGASASPPPVTLLYALSVDRKRNELRDRSGPHVPDLEDE
jgi:hypothetical protein